MDGDRDRREPLQELLVVVGIVPRRSQDQDINALTKRDRVRAVPFDP